jgi:hypothetical protein
MLYYISFEEFKHTNNISFTFEHSNGVFKYHRTNASNMENWKAGEYYVWDIKANERLIE